MPRYKAVITIDAGAFSDITTELESENAKTAEIEALLDFLESEDVASCFNVEVKEIPDAQ